MKITFIITNLAVGGAETMLLKLLQHIDRRRFEPTVISLIGMDHIGPRIEALGVPVYALGMRRGTPNPMMVIALARLLLRIKPDLVHTWMYHADLLGGLAARLTGCSDVVWGLRHSNLSKAENKPTTLMVVRICALLSCWLPAQILSCSSRAKIVHAAVGYQNDKIHVIPNGFELNRFQPDLSARHSVRAELGVRGDTPLVGLVARYDSQKNHAGFFRAAALVHAARPDVHFVLAGAGIEKSNDKLQAVLAGYPRLLTHVHCLGRREDVPRLMASLDVLASSSHGEAFPNVLGEAMACGVSCVVTDVGDSAEIVGATGRVVPAGDMDGLANHLLAVLQLTRAERTALGEQARLRVAAQYEIGHVVARYEAFYEQILTKRNRGNS